MRHPLHVRFVRHVSLVLGGQGAQGLGALIAGVLVARALGPEGRGQISVLLALGAVVILLAALGLPTSSIYMLGRHPSRRDEILTNNLLAAALGGLLSTAALAAVGLAFRDSLLPGIPFAFFLVYLAAIPFLYAIQFLQQVGLGIGSVRLYTLVYALQGAGLLAGTVACLVIFGSHVVPLLALRVALAAAIAAVALAGLRRRTALRLKASRPLLHAQLGYGLRAFAASLMWIVLLRSDIVLCNHFLGPGPTGIYSVTAALGWPFDVVAGTIGVLVQQRVASGRDLRGGIANTNRVMRLLVPLALATVLVVGLGSWVAIPLIYGAAFEPAWHALLWLLPGFFALALETVLMKYMAGVGWPPVVYRAPIAGLVLNFAANLVLIPRLGINGAAIASSCAYLLVFALVLRDYRSRTGSTLREILLLRRADLAALFPRPASAGGLA